MKEDEEKIKKFIKRLEKLRITVKLSANYPWIYLSEICGKRVSEKFLSDYGFTVAFAPVRRDKPLVFTDTTEIFKLIRKYIEL